MFFFHSFVLFWLKGHFNNTAAKFGMATNEVISDTTDKVSHFSSNSVCTFSETSKNKINNKNKNKSEDRFGNLEDVFSGGVHLLSECLSERIPAWAFEVVL